jgi:hypothetical protein
MGLVVGLHINAVHKMKAQIKKVISGFLRKNANAFFIVRFMIEKECVTQKTSLLLSTAARYFSSTTFE